MGLEFVFGYARRKFAESFLRFVSLAGLFPLTGTGWVVLLLFSYNVALVPPCMIISLVFSKVKSASNATSVFSIPVLLSIPLGLVGGFHKTKAILSVFAPIGFSLALGASVYTCVTCAVCYFFDKSRCLTGRVVELEGQGKGLSWDTGTSPPATSALIQPNVYLLLFTQVMRTRVSGTSGCE